MVSTRAPQALLVGIVLLHGLLYLWLVPPWQAPDEPTQFEYAALIARTGRVPDPSDTDAALEQRLVESLARQRFFEYLLSQPPPQPLTRLADAQAHFFMPRQVGGDPPLYFILAAIPIRLLDARPIEEQLLSMRLLGLVWMVGTVLCAYKAAYALIEARGFALAVGLLVTLQPMFVFIGVDGGNDGLANLIGAAICWCTIDLARRPHAPWRRVLGLSVLLLLGLATKRSILPLVAALASLGGIWAVVRLVRVPLAPALRGGLAGLLLLTLGFGVGSTISAGRVAGGAAEWHGNTEDSLAPRVLRAPGTGRPALELRPGQVALQALPAVVAESTQEGDLRVDARVWTAGEAGRGRLRIDVGLASTEVPFDAAAAAQTIRTHLAVPLYSPYVHIIVSAEDGTIYADQLAATSDRQPELNLLSNGDIAGAGLRPGSPPDKITRYLHLREIEWAWRSGRLRGLPPHGWVLARIFFVSFWGQFGWMSIPLVGSTPWEGALLLLCAGGLLGTLAWLARPRRDPATRRAVLALVLLVLSGLLFPVLNAYIQPRDQVLQQGRYLFPAFVPIALLLVLGWRTLVPRAWRGAALVAWSLFWLVFAAAAQQLIMRGYHY